MATTPRTIRLSAEQWDSLEALAQRTGYAGNRSAFISAIADGDIVVATAPDIHRRIDKMRDRIEQLEEQRRIDADRLTEALVMMHRASEA
jgi:septal ring factor EnvC (AmiA/AmiB activator)